MSRLLKSNLSLAARLSRLALLVGLCVLVWACGPATPPEGLVARLAAGQQSPELFTLPNGINEFDLVYAGGRYHLYYDDKTQARHRSAPTLAGLATAADDLAIPGRYPSVLAHAGLWYLWVYDPATLRTRLYRSHEPQGPFGLAAEWAGPRYYSDWRVSRDPATGRFLAVYKHVKTLKTGLLTANSPDGPWLDQGPLFDPADREGWHAVEEADPVVIFHAGRAYLAFAGWDGEMQRVGMALLDPKGFKVSGPAWVLVEPTRPWQQRGGRKKVFSPTWLVGPRGHGRLFFAHNPSAPGIAAGWAYLELAAR